ncbi:MULTISPECIES: hypothetical protein [Pseudomonas syringae group]|uniref:Uncharacterized protein n=1 Tax=Pseudomonas syringae pv. ribicola TaxID=55398 RepID=A0A3M2VIE8_PSESI|nr:hypothetical protein [Pseudomonas syringae group genomosp. 3]RML39061.1 hypothetical protein ALQ95_02238 [Pseudomonas syringae pv. ribicola]
MINVRLEAKNTTQLSVMKELLKKNEEVVGDPSEKNTAATSVEGVKVSLSSVGLQKSATDDSNQDIENSGLPEQAQKVLKIIREIQQKIAEKQAELQALAADQSMDPETRQNKIRALQTEISGFSASLSTANASLQKLSKNGTLTESQGKQAALLAMKS